MRSLSGEKATAGSETPQAAQRDALSVKVSSQARSMLAFSFVRDQQYLGLREARASGEDFQSKVLKSEGLLGIP